MVYAGTGTVWDNLTFRLPVLNPTPWYPRWSGAALFCALQPSPSCCLCSPGPHTYSPSCCSCSQLSFVLPHPYSCPQSLIRGLPSVPCLYACYHPSSWCFCCCREYFTLSHTYPWRPWIFHEHSMSTWCAVHGVHGCISCSLLYMESMCTLCALHMHFLKYCALHEQHSNSVSWAVWTIFRGLLIDCS